MQLPENEENRVVVIQNANNVTILQTANLLQDSAFHLAGRSPRDKKMLVEGFTNDVNARTIDQVKSTIARDFDGDIQEPKSEVAPVLVKTNFFRGGTALDEVDYSVPDERRRKKTTKKTRQTEVHLQDLHKHGRYIMLVGGAGSGKTTLIKRYCSRVLEKRVKNMEEVEVVHFINVRDLSKDEITPREALFGKFLLGEHKKERVKYGYEWLQKEENQNKVLLAFDGMDTAPWILNNDAHDLLSYDDKNQAATIMYNILRGQLFPKCKLLLTSREYGITRFPRRIRPDAVVALKGFTRESIMVLVKELGGDKGDAIWNALLQKSVNLMLLCSTPLFLIFAIIVYKEYDNPPENLSGIIITLIESHIRSDHRLVEDVRGIIEKLKILSLQGLKDGTVVFTAKEFKCQGLEVDDVKDLVINVPAPNEAACTQKLLEEDYCYFFCHQAFQESLAALQVAGEDFENFKDFVDQFLHSPRYIVVRQILCGVLFSEETTRLAKRQADVTKKERKQDYLLKTLSSELVKSKDSPMDMLNLLISLRECGSQQYIVKMVKENLPKISLSGIPLTPSDLHATASVAQHCDRLSIMQLVNCHLDNRSLEVLAEGMKGSNVEITVFDVSFNGNLRKDSMFHLHEICTRGQGLNYWQCGFRQIDILTFNERESQRRTEEVSEPSDEDVIRRTFVEDKVLDLGSYNVENYPDLLRELIREISENDQLRANLIDYEANTKVECVCELLRSCKSIREFSISESELTDAQLKEMHEAVKSKMIETLNVFLNPGIEEKGWITIGKIAKTCSAKNLYITACSLTEAKLRGFKFTLKGGEIHKLDISRNDNMDEYCMREIGEIVDTCGVRELVMGYCNFKKEHIKCLKRSVRSKTLNRIDMSGNDGMEDEGFYALGEIVYSCEVQLLDISECDPSPSEIANFKEATHNVKMTKLNVSRNRNMKESGLQDVGELVGKCMLHELFVRQCELEEHTLRSFRLGLGDSKIRHLDLGFYFMKVRPTTDAEIDIIIDMLPNITEQLTLNDWDISEKGRRELQRALDRLPYIGLKIVFNRGKEDLIRQSKPDQ